MSSDDEDHDVKGTGKPQDIEGFALNANGKGQGKGKDINGVGKNGGKGTAQTGQGVGGAIIHYSAWPKPVALIM